ncbi:TPA: DDE-type integrase/transposase/recombinase [Bacillus pseudomycoides]|nr:DDE-type integrase/transposase/recombinase [Bacillus pseudomycoides]
MKYGYIEGEDRFFYILSIIDVYDRSIVNYQIGLHCTGKDAGHLVQRTLFKRKQFEKEHKPMIRTDNGPQFISNAFEKVCHTCEALHVSNICRSLSRSSQIY